MSTTLHDGSNHEPTHASDTYDIVSNLILCLNCKALTTVYGFALPDCTMPFFIHRLSRSAVDEIQKLTDSYWFDTDPHTSRSFWMNHCQRCAAQIKEEDIFEESRLGEGPFGPEPYEGDDELEAQRFHGSFQAWADDELEDWAPDPDEDANP